MPNLEDYRLSVIVSCELMITHLFDIVWNFYNNTAGLVAGSESGNLTVRRDMWLIRILDVPCQSIAQVAKTDVHGVDLWTRRKKQ